MTQLKSLSDLGLLNETDKASLHKFTDFYELKLSHLRDKNIKL